MRAIIVGLLLSLTTTGCDGKIPNMAELRKLKPEVNFKDVKVKGITFQNIDTDFIMQVKNPYPVGMKVASNDWSLSLAGSDFLDGSGGKLNIGANGRSPVKIPIKMAWADAFRVAGAMKGKDEIPFVFQTRMGFNTPVGEIKVPLRHEGTLPALHVPRVQLNGLKVKGIDLATQTAKLALNLGVESDQGSNISFDAFDYNVKFNGSRVANGNTRLANIGGSSNLSIPINVNLLELGAGIANAIKTKGNLDVGLGAQINVGTPFGSVPLNIDKAKKLKLN